MKSLLAFVLIIGIAFVTFKVHQDRVDAAAERAAVDAAERTRAELMRKPKAAPKTPGIHVVSLSRRLEPHYFEVFSPINLTSPADLVIPLELTRERILDEMTRVAPGERPLYQSAADFVANLMDAAEERTKAIQAGMIARSKGGALDSKTSPNTTGSFFAQGATRRWEEQKKQLKQRADQVLARLRNAEREWNAQAPENASVDSFDPPEIAAVYVTAETEVRSNPLERGTYNDRRMLYPWRRAYYGTSR
ncbi:MAG TPA: hypothetical protein VFV83_04220 [Chthoniobacteraceae bacterium]|nr:hypothetical protein [Chthoniobacteraceae bacterium]